MRGREGYGITEVGWGGERASSCHLLDGGGRLSATPTSTALTLRVKVWYGTGWVLYVYTQPYYTWRGQDSCDFV